VLVTRIGALVALALAPALAIQGYNEYALRSAREEEVRVGTLRAARAAAADLAQIGDGLRQILDLVGEEDAVRSKEPAACTAYLRGAASRLPGIGLLAVTEPDGRVVCNSLGTPAGAYSNADRAYLQRAVESGTFAIGDYVESVPTGRPSLHAALPLRDAGGATVALVVAAIDLDWLAGRLARAALAPETALSVIDEPGRVLVRLPDQAAWVGRQIDKDRLSVIAANVGEARDIIAWDGRRRIVAVAKPEGALGALTVSVGRDRAALFADIDAATLRGVVLILLGAVLAFAAAFVGGRLFIRRPVRRLLEAATAWRGGDLSARTRLGGGSEFGRLGAAFDAMAASLQQHEGELTSEVRRSRALQEQQSVMLHELNHRVKNTLATVQALARQSRGGEGQAAQLEGRILALSKTHDLLTRDDWTGAPLREMLENELGPYRNGSEHCVLDGPEVALPPRHVLALGMTVHELTTNAAKYGALSREAGQVSVKWRTVRGEGGGETLLLDWQERGGPPVSEPRRRGFGTRLIAGGVTRELDGSVEMEFHPAGLRCSIRVPLPPPERA
jgi:two-component sensor histidine kinase